MRLSIPAKQVQRQVKLPFMKSVEIAVRGLRVRFFRSLITTLSLVLAIAFFSFVMIGNHVANGLLRSGDQRARQELIRSGYDLGPQDTRVSGNPKQRWILVLSLVVCVVGIVNAQLMAVTERFREIGTMKCLGALDRFVLRLFLLEAGMQGLVGASAGALIGAGFALAAGLARFGTAALVHLDWGQFAAATLWATATGCLLSVLGVIYPALLAARMQPVEAMRVEQ